MATFSAGMLLIFLIAAAITALAMLSVFSNIIEHETQLHDLRNRVKELHYQQAMYLARINGRIAFEEDGEVEILDDDFDLEQDGIEIGTDALDGIELPSSSQPSRQAA